MNLTNPEIHGYCGLPVYENHMHLKYEMSLEDAISATEAIASHFNYGKMQICALPFYDRTENYKAFHLKSELNPSVYVSVGIDHHYDERDTSGFYLSEIKKYYDMGCDGIKMFEGKMKAHRKLGKKLCDPVFDEFYKFAVEKKLPIIIHLGDPAEMWDLSKCSQYAIDNGWYCSEEDPSRDELREEVENVLKKFPELRVVMAHFYFMGDELDKASAFLERWKNAYFDLTPGGEMYVSFTADYNNAYKFFEKYQDRILYGTDTYTLPASSQNPEEKYSPRINLVRTYLEKTEPFGLYGNENTMLKPFGLPDEILNKIYRENFVRLYGNTPRALDYEKIAYGCRALLDDDESERLDLKKARKLTEYFDIKSAEMLK